MPRLYVDPDARHPLYPGAMPLSQVREGVQFVTLDTERGSFELTALASKWRAETVPIVSGNGFDLASIICLRANDIRGSIIDLHEKGIHPPVEASGYWNARHISVRADRDNILALHPWLVKEGFARAANEIEDRFFDFFTDYTTLWNELLRGSSA